MSEARVHLDADCPPLTERRSADYEIGEMLGHGGMGVVLAATDQGLGRIVAMKMILDGRHAAPELKARFLNEARTLACLEHPNIVPLHELAVNEFGELYYTMKRVQGDTLAHLLADPGRPLILATLLPVFEKICHAVAFAHSRGFLHRDLKPENVMLGSFGEVLVMDWGLAARMDEPPADLRGASPPLISRLTHPEGRLGTPGYASPEQTGALPIDERADVFSLGRILRTILSAQAVPAPRALSAVAVKASAEDAANRHASVDELLADLAAWREDRLTSAEKSSWQRRASLFARRHRNILTPLAVGGLLLSIVVSGFLLRITAAQRQTLQTLDQLRATAPSYYNWALSALANHDPERAAGQIRSAILLDPKQADFHLLDARIAHILGQFDRADHAISEAQIARPGLAQDLAGINGRFGPRSAASDSREFVRELAEAMIQDKRGLDALNLVLRHSAVLAGPDWHRYLAEHLVLTEDGTGLALDVRDSDLNDLRPITWIPLEYLSLYFIPVKDLSPLAAMPLRRLHVFLHRIESAGALSGLPLTELSLSLSSGSPGSLDFVARMPLRELAISGQSLSDLSPLRGKQLISFRIWNSPVTDISVLAGMPLKELTANSCRKLEDLQPLRGLPLERLCLASTRVVDLSPLRGLPLRELNLSGTPVTDLSPLKGLPIQKLDLGKAKNLRDLSPLRDLPGLRDLVLPPIPGLTPEMLPALDRLSYDRSGSTRYWSATKTAAEFWALREAAPGDNAPATGPENVPTE